MTVPFIDLQRLMKDLHAPVMAHWEDALKKCEFVGGPRVQEVERLISEQIGAKHTVSCANGTDAIILALQALGVRHGSRVALPNLTFWATYEAVAQLKATPILIDIDPDDLQMSFSEFEKAHKAYRFDTAILVHLYGWASRRLSDFRSYCEANRIGLVEDGAQSFGVEVGGKSVFAGAQISTLSFYPAKVIGGAMDGGSVSTDNEDAAKLVRTLANHGRATHYSYSHVGWNSRMGGVQAGFLLEMLKRSKDIVSNRRKAADYYHQHLKHPKLKKFGPPSGVLENGYLNVINADGFTGDQLVAAMKEKGIGCARTYPEPISAQAPTFGVAIPHGDLQISTNMCRNVANLPIFYGITEAEQQEAMSALMSVLG